jgi:hypothetical protein
VTDAKTEPTTSPLLRMGVAIFFLGCAALAITYAWVEFERSEVERLETKRLEEASMNITTKADSNVEKSP